MQIVVARAGDKLKEQWDAMWDGIEMMDIERDRLERELNEVRRNRRNSNHPDDDGFIDEAEMFQQQLGRVHQCNVVLEREWNRAIARARGRALLLRPWLIFSRFQGTTSGIEGLVVHYGAKAVGGSVVTSDRC